MGVHSPSKATVTKKSLFNNGFHVKHANVWGADRLVVMLEPLSQPAGYFVKKTKEKVVGPFDDVQPGIRIPLAHESIGRRIPSLKSMNATGGATMVIPFTNKLPCRAMALTQAPKEYPER